MHKTVKILLVAAIAVLLMISALPVKKLVNYTAFLFMDKNELTIGMKLANPQVKLVSADISNRLVLKVEVRNTSGRPVSNVFTRITVNNGAGTVSPSEIITDKYGEALVIYTPPDSSAMLVENKNTDVTLSANILKCNTSASVKVRLAPVPLVLIHGYQENSALFDNMNKYLSKRGFSCSTFNYKSENGVIHGAKELEAFLQKQKSAYLSKNMQVGKFDLITHSMGGLVARYYTCGTDYGKNNDVNKLIFLSVPQRGSHWAPIGARYFNDQGIRDLIPENPLYTGVFPRMANKGLNSTIQAGSILGQFDEVVSPESSSLEEWNIKTEVFSVGDNNFTVDNLLNGNIIQATNHKAILNNKKVFEKITEMLENPLPFPAVKR